jgi:hypothetical protein
LSFFKSAFVCLRCGAWELELTLVIPEVDCERVAGFFLAPGPSSFNAER